MSKGRPAPVRYPRWASRVTRSVLLVTGPSSRISPVAGLGVGAGTPVGLGRSMTISSAAPVCQRIPIRALARLASGSKVTSAIRVRSRRLRSRGGGVGACPGAGRLGRAGHVAGGGERERDLLGGQRG